MAPDTGRPVSAFRRLWADERGMSLPEVLVSVIINGLSLLTIAAAIITFSVIQQSTSIAAAASTTVSTTEALWRSTVQPATKIVVVDRSSATFSRPAADGSCLEKTVSFTAVNGLERMSVSSQRFTGPVDDLDGSCSGVTDGDPQTVTTAFDVGLDSGMDFSSISGRAMTFDAGAVTLSDAAAKPATVTDAAWASTTIGSAAVSITAAASTAQSKSARIVQVAGSQAGGPAAVSADAASTLVTQ